MAEISPSGKRICRKSQGNITRERFQAQGPGNSCSCQAIETGKNRRKCWRC
jgi:hypothetical protein